MTLLTGRGLRMARAGLSWTRKELAHKAKIDPATVKRMEASDGPMKARYDTIQAILAVFERVGMKFPDEPHPEAVTVRYLPPSKSR